MLFMLGMGNGDRSVRYNTNEQLVVDNLSSSYHIIVHQKGCAAGIMEKDVKGMHDFGLRQGKLIIGLGLNQII